MGKTVSVGVEVDLKAKASSMKKLYDDVSNLMANIDPSSSLSKSMNKALGKLKDQVTDFELISNKSFISQGDINSALNLFKRFYRDIGRMNENVQSAGFSSFIHEDSVIQALQKVQNELDNVKSAAEQIKSINIGDAFKMTGKEEKAIKDLQQKFSLSDDNGISIVDARSDAIANLTAKEEEYNKALEKQNILQENQKKIQDKINSRKNAQQTYFGTSDQRRNFRLNQTFEKVGALKKNLATDTYEYEFAQIFDSLVIKDKTGLVTKFAPDGRERLNILAGFLGINLSTIKDDAASLHAEVIKSLSNVSNKKFTDTIGSSRLEFSKAGPDYQLAKQAWEMYDGFSIKGELELNKDLKSSQTELAQVQANLSILKGLQDEAESLQNQINELYNTIYGDIDKKVNQQTKSLREERDRILKNADRATKSGMENTTALAGEEVSQLAEDVEIDKASQRAQQQAETFKNNLKQGIRHWMGAQQIMTQLHNGIRSAYNDIKALDKSMTDIAVVTDFSVSDLWGKINEYMAVAQQYGVTTQGVYEVSQLYFQQGLGEADTMTLTTETLKMARIAGMEYKDAADGMTVALRGFKMEMEDAARVTDVYSKVAAVTASDSQELIEAMSKTASSAASVGSGFEETTAMLAVMIEATREAPTNIGSAMKSIISRYGEMTKGMSVDTEGEEIVFNKVDAALQSVGVSMKDATGQFREFDEVIYELASKWESLDSLSQRYVATVFAGNRQQSRFLALMSNYDRLVEVTESAENSEDAGLLQYSKTLDSLETKLNSIKTSFQQFYMNILNGDTFKGLLDVVNDILTALNKLPKLETVLGIGGAIISIKKFSNSIVDGLFGVFNKVSRGGSIKDTLFGGAKAGGSAIKNFFKKKIGKSEKVEEKTEQKQPQQKEELKLEVEELTVKSLESQVSKAKDQVKEATELQTIVDKDYNKALENQKKEVAQNRVDKYWLNQHEEEAKEAQRKRDEYLQIAEEKERKASYSTKPGQQKSRKELLKQADEARKAAAEADKELAEANAKVIEQKEKVAKSDKKVAEANEELDRQIKNQKDAARIAEEAHTDLEVAEFELEREKKETRKENIVNGISAIGGDVLSIVGAGLTLSAIKTADSNINLSKKLSAAGTVASVGGQITSLAAQIHPLAGAVAAVGTAVVAAGAAIFTTASELEVAQQNLDNAKAESEEANIKRAEARERANSLKSTIQQLEELEKAQYDSEEAHQAYLEASNAAFEKFPELVATFDEAGNAIVDINTNISNAEELLISSRKAAAAAALEAAAAEAKVANAELSTDRAEANTKKYSDIISTILPNDLINFEMFGIEEDFTGPLGEYKVQLEEFIVNLDRTDLTDAQKIQEYIDFTRTLKPNEDEIAPEKTNAYNYLLERIKNGIGFGLNSGLFTDSEIEQIRTEDLSLEDLTNILYGKVNEVIYELEQDVISLNSANKATVLNKINKEITNLDPLGEGLDWQQIEGAYETFQKEFLTKEFLESLEFDEDQNLTLDSAQKIESKVAELQEEYQNFYDGLENNFKLNSYNDLIRAAESGQITFSEYSKQLQDFFGIIPEVAQKSLDNFEEEAKQAEQNIDTSLRTERTVDWSAITVRTAHIAQTYYDEIVAFANKIDEMVESQTITGEQGQAIAKAYGNLWGTIYTSVDENLQNIARNLLKDADLTSITGVMDLMSSFEEAGINISEFDFTSIINNLSVNLITEWEALQTKIASNLDSVSEALSDASGGINSAEEAIKLANKIGVSLSDFRVEDGKFYYDDPAKIRAALEKNYEKTVEELNNRAQSYVNVSESMAAFTSQANFDAELESIEGKLSSVIINEDGGITDLGVYSTQADYLADIQKKSVIKSFSDSYLNQLNEEGGIQNFTEYLAQYLQTQSEEIINILNQWMEDQTASIERDNSIRELTSKYAGSEQEQLQQEAWNKLSQGITNLTANEIATIEHDLGMVFQKTRNADGTYNIVQSEIGKFPEWVQIALASIIQSQVDSAKESLESLTEAVAKQEQLSTAQKRDILGESFKERSDSYIEGIWNVFQSARETGDFAYLEKALTQHFISGGLDPEAAAREAREAIAHFQDNIDENIKNILDLKLSLLEGTISEEEKIILTTQDASFIEKYNQALDETITKSIQERASKIYELYSEYYNQALEADEITFEEARTGKAKAAAKQFDEALRISEIGGAETFRREAKEDLLTGNRLFDTEELGNFYVAFEKQLGLTQEEFLKEYMVGMTKTGEVLLDIKKLSEKGIITEQDYAQFQRNFAKETFGSAEDLITRMASGEKVYADEITSLFESMGMVLTPERAEQLASGSTAALLNQIEESLLASGVPESDISNRLTEIQAQIVDILLNSISSGISSLGSGLEGTLSAADYQSLAKKYGLTGVGTSKSSKGIRLGAADQQKLISRMFIDAQNAGMESDFGEQIWEVYRDNQEDTIDGYTAIEKEIARVKGEHKELTGEALAYVEALQQARAAAMFDENAYEFAFMEQDATSGLTKNFDKFASQIDKVKEAFTSFQNDEAIGYQDFYNMMDFIGNSEAGFAKFSEMTGIAASDYDAFVNSVVANTDEWGKVDIGGVAAEMGISVDAAMSAMSESMTESLKEVAKQQVKYLTSVEQMLEAMLILEGIGSIDLSMTFSFQGNEYQLKDVYNVWKDLDEQGKKELEVVLKTALEGQGEGGQMIIDAIWGDGDGMDFLEAGMLSFFGGKADWLATPEGQTFMNSLGGLTEGLALDMASILSDEDYSQYFNKEGTGFADGMMDAFFAQYFSDLTGIDFNSLRENASIQLSQLLAQSGGTMELDMGENSITLTGMDGNNLQFADGTNITEDMMGQLTQSLQTAMGREGMELSLTDGAVTVTNWGTAISNASEGVEQINENFATAAEAAIQLNTAITSISTVASSFQSGEGFQTLADQLNAAADAAERLNGALSSGEVEGPDTSFIEAQLASAEQALALLQMGGAQPEIIADAETQVTALQTQLNSLTVPEGTTAGLVGELTNAIDVANRLSEALASNNGTPLEVNFNADDANGQVTTLITNLLQLNNVFQPTVTVDDAEAQATIADVLIQLKNVHIQNPTPIINVEDQASSILESIIALIASIKSKTVTITTIHKDVYVTSGSSSNGGVSDKGGKDDGGPGPFAGTMNGLAFADGSLGRLHSGAVLANKALVGELGPELAVYDGQYHMLGANGAEFVDLPSDAIIFNHLQTQGILRGQMNIRGTAMAEGNVSGPAYASGIGAALSAVRRAKSVWQGLLNSLSAADLMGAGGGGGGGGDESLKAHIADLQEWYNLSRQIADIEGQINVLLAKRKNITDGHEYLKNLRETQRLLDDQVNTQQDLLRFQELQLQRQAEHINTNKIWSQFLEVDENGLLQYKKGNETNGGKGALEVLSQMNEMSGEEQLAFVQSLGWSYTNTDGEELENEELVAKFYEELQKQIDDYDALRDTIQETEGTLADLEEQINEIEKEIRDNEIDLSKEIYDIIVDAWQENIENLKEQNDLIKEANEAYANGIQEAIDAERQMYDQNTAISDREQLQRQLALMRRSGGSASEIADLEQQLDDMLKEEYFSKQEKQLETIQKANERQAELMDQQVKLQEEVLEYEKENGVIWAKVYDIMQGTDAEILDFISGNKTDFIEQSVLQQEDMLTEWAKKIGIFTAERERQYYAKEGIESFNAIWDTKEGKTLKDSFNKADAEYQEEWKREFGDTYASAIISGKSPKEALDLAQKELFEHIKNWMKAQADSGKKYAKGGVINYTGPAWVDGSKSKPERILSAEQNRILEEGLAMNAGRSDRLREVFSNFAESLGASVRASISNITNRTSSSAITIQPGAVQLNIEQLNDKYDVEELFNDVADRLYSIASRASGRGVSRR